MNFIYLTTNILNGKQYIGSHRGDKEDNYLGSGLALKRAIKKYGKENFKRKILKECKSKNNLILEEKYIQEYNTLQPNGYNISPKGGNGIPGGASEETIKKIRGSQKGKSKLLYFIEKFGEKKGRIKYNEWIEALRKNSKGRIKSLNEIEKIRKSSIGRPCSDERKLKIGKANSISLKGKKQSKQTIEKRMNTMGDVWNKGKKQYWIHNENLGSTKIILFSELDDYLADGWIKGRGKLK